MSCPACADTGFNPLIGGTCLCVEKGPNLIHRAMTDALTGDLPDPHGFVVDVGKHKGERLTRIPIGYLRWMVNSAHQYADYAEAEIRRRGTDLPDIDISAHAIDRASLRLVPAWKGTRQRKEGLHSWLARMAVRALENPAFRPNCHQYMGIVFVFASEGRWPVLKSVWPAQRGQEDDEEEDYVA